MRSWKPHLLSYAVAVSVAVMTQAGVSAWADAQLKGLSFEGNTLTLSGVQPMSKPNVDVWPGSKASTELVIINLPGVQGDAPQLQRQAEQLMLGNPQIKKFLVDGTNPANLQIVLEVTVPAGQEPPTPNIQSSTPQIWQIHLNPTANESSTATTLADKNQFPTVTESTQPQPDIRTVTPEKPGGFFSKLLAKKSETIAIPSEEQQELSRLAEELQNLINERDQLENELHATQHQLAQLRQERKPIEDDGDTRLRDYNPLFDGSMPDRVVIANLRKALSTTAAKLKATEAALEAQTQTTRQLASELAALKKDPSLLKDPKLIAKVQDGAPVPSSNQPAPLTKEELIKKGIQYQPDPKSSQVRQDPKRLEEINLRVAIKEHPEQPEAYLKLADLYVGRNQLSQSENILQRLIANVPTCHEAYYYLSLVYLGQQRRLEAQATLETYKRLNPKDQSRILSVERAIQSATKR